MPSFAPVPARLSLRAKGRVYLGRQSGFHENVAPGPVPGVRQLWRNSAIPNWPNRVDNPSGSTRIDLRSIAAHTAFHA